MMKQPRNLLIFAVLGGIVGLGLGFISGRISAPDGTRAVKTDETAAIKAVLMAQQDAWNSGDIEGFMEGYLQSDRLRFASGGDITRGWHGTLSRYQTRYSDRKKMGTLKFDLKTVDIIDEDDGLVFGQWTLVRDMDKPKGLFTLHMRKGSEGWKVVSDHTSSADD